jgi:uncharacterized membrane protein
VQFLNARAPTVLLLQCCHTIVTVLLHCYYTVVPQLSHCGYTVVTLFGYTVRLHCLVTLSVGAAAGAGGPGLYKDYTKTILTLHLHRTDTMLTRCLNYVHTA